MKRETHWEPVGADQDEPEAVEPWITIGEDPDDQKNAKALWRDLSGRYDIDHADLQSFFYRLWANRNHLALILKGERVRKWAIFLLAVHWSTLSVVNIQFPGAAAHFIWAVFSLGQCALWVRAFAIAMRADDGGKPHPDIPSAPGMLLPGWAALMTGAWAFRELCSWLERVV